MQQTKTNIMQQTDKNTIMTNFKQHHIFNLFIICPEYNVSDWVQPFLNQILESYEEYDLDGGQNDDFYYAQYQFTINHNIEPERHIKLQLADLFNALELNLVLAISKQLNWGGDDNLIDYAPEGLSMLQQICIIKGLLLDLPLEQSFNHFLNLINNFYLDGELMADADSDICRIYSPYLTLEYYTETFDYHINHAGHLFTSKGPVYTLDNE